MRRSEAFGTTSGAIGLVIASVLWGTTGTAASFLPDGVSPLATGAATMATGGMLLLLVSARGALSALRDPSARGWIALGAVGVVVYPLAFYSAMDLAGVAIGNVVALGSGPLFAAILEWAIERRRPTRRWGAATAVALAGIVILPFGADDADAGRGDLTLGVLLGLLAGAAYAQYTYASSRAIATGHRGRSIMGAMFGLGAVLLTPVLLATGAPLLQSGGTIAITAYLALGPMFVAYLFFGAALRVLRSSTATTITLLEPVVATVLAVAVVGERLTSLGWSGIALILAGVAIIATANRGTGTRTGPSATSVDWQT
ncbi:DME family drug/metabolite transporter [Marisediminicola sp. UYEF4]|uniref:DMT family transporter n=1 Tax=Marisediminicola sp. UYEF4 TaxID=1756384 RepID=UPI003393BEA0